MSLASGYIANNRRRLLLLALLVLLLLPATMFSLWIGSFRLPITTILSSLFSGSDDSLIQHLIWNLRLPRTLAALVAGTGLALSGNVMQTLLSNPLAAPSTLGVSQGAAFGATVAIVLFKIGYLYPADNAGALLTAHGTIAACAFCGSLISILAILAISTFRQLSSEAMILAGVAMGAFLSAGTMLLQYFADDSQVAASLIWTFGDLGKAGWQEIRLPALLLLPTGGYLLTRAWCLNSLQMGTDVARTMGVATGRLRLIGLLLVCLLVAVITAFWGIIAFVGLMAPHLMRPLIGTDQRFLMPASALCGALLLLIADCISRTVLAPVVIPVGIVTSFTGAPLFLYLLLKRRPS
jgi:iron complex transport system permease protein